MNPFDELTNGFAATAGGHLVPGAAGYPVGAVATVLSSEDEARRFIDLHGEGIATLGLGEVGYEPVGDPWKFMRLAAGEGLAGITPGDPGIAARFMFMVRVEEAGRELPTVLTAITDAGWGSSLTRTGARSLRHAELLHWSRFDILDQVSGRWGTRCPFRGWDHGEPLFELSAPGRLILLGDVGLFGDWNSTEGAIPFFTDEDAAWHYLQHHLGSVPAAEMGFPVPGRAADAELEPLRPVPVPDLRARLAELRDLAPFAAWCVNPDEHRENAAIGRMWDEVLADGDPSMRAVSGIWRIRPGNQFELVEPLAPWSGSDTIRWSGGTALQLHALDRSFVGSEVEAGLSETEADELVEARLDAVGLEPLWDQMVELEGLPDGRRLDLFHVVSWDAVTGEGADFPARFTGFLDALKYLATFERLHDRIHRADGSQSCQHVGFWGSGDQEAEDLRSARFQLGLKRLGLRVLRDGYRPTDADDLVALCNGTLRTLHVNYAGFAVDLLWASPDDDVPDEDEAEVEVDEWEEPAGQRGRLLQQLELSGDAWDERVAALQTPVDPAGERLAVARMAEDPWESLEPLVRHFVSTGLLHLDRQGHAPMLDYAPISIELVKALEVELGAVFEAFKRSLDDDVPSGDADNHTERSLEGFLGGAKPPTLGAMAYLLRDPGDGASALAVRLHQFVSGLPNAADLTRSKFLKRGLNRVLHKYRNGGAHDSPISEAACRECADVLVGTPGKPGYIPMVAAWKR